MRWTFPVALVCAVIAGAFAGIEGWRSPRVAAEIVDTVAAISAILTGFSLAIVAIISAPHESVKGDRGEAANAIIKLTDLDLVNQQIFVFLGFSLNLLCAVALKYTSELPAVDWSGLFERLLGSLFMASLCYSLILAMSLPFILKALIIARKT